MKLLGKWIRISSVVAAGCLAGGCVAASVHAQQAGPGRAERAQAGRAPGGRGGARGGGPPTPEEMKGKTAAQVYKNIKVLNDVPAIQLADGMRYITIALGVRCNSCHNPRDFSSDEKRPKKTARNMMKMLFAINKENFKDRQTVSCFTCHKGHQGPSFAPTPATETAQPATEPVPPMTLVAAKQIKLKPGAPEPTVAQILAKYGQALGGNAALANARSRQLMVERTGGGENSKPVEEEVYEKAPNLMLIVTHNKNNTSRAGYDGKQGWASTRRGSREIDAMDALVPFREAQIDPAKALKDYKGMRLRAKAQIGKRMTYLVTGQAPDGMDERLYFDTTSGLLVRRLFIYRTIFGPLLFQADYSHYQKEGNVLIPLQTQWWAQGSGFTETVKSVKTNPPISNAEFQRPPQSAGGARGPAAGRGER